MRIFRLVLLLPLLSPLPLLAQPASVVRDSEMKAEPFADAKTITVLKTKQKVEVGVRRGGWYQAKSSDGKTGWLRLTSVLISSTQGRGDNGVASTAKLLQTGRSGSTGVTAATGVRGLDSADVVNANPDTAAVVKLDAMQINSAQTRRFAADGQLSAQGIDYLPAEGK
jgi:hypothetical protein